MEGTPDNFKRIVKDEDLPPLNPMECGNFGTPGAGTGHEPERAAGLGREATEGRS